MIERKNIGRASPLLLVFLALGFFFATYNLLTMILHNKAPGSSNWGADGLDLFDPIIQKPEEAKREGNSNLRFHVALTATDAPYSKWQCRIMYYWYKKVKHMPGSDMGGFTRVLHSGKPDNLMEEIPTFVVDPLPAGLDRVRILLLSLSGFLLFMISFTNVAYGCPLRIELPHCVLDIILCTNPCCKWSNYKKCKQLTQIIVKKRNCSF